MSQHHALATLHLKSVGAFFRSNLRIIFAHRFRYFLAASILAYILISLLVSLDTDNILTASTVYGILMLPGLLLIFYPCVYGIQLDADAGMLETLFGIPNYRYKIYLIRLMLTFALTAVLLVVFSVLSNFLIAPIPILPMVFHLMFPLVFLGCIAFLLATLTHSGHAAGTIVIGLGFVSWLSAGFLGESRWNLFHNPFKENSGINALAQADVTFYNRIILLVIAVLAVLWAMLNLQRREKFL